MKNLDNLMFIGYDANLNAHFVEIPELLREYKGALSDAVINVFYNKHPESTLPKDFIKNMEQRDILHKFIEKHTLSIFRTINTEEELETIIKNQCKKLFDIKEEDDTFKKLYKNYKKSTSIESYFYDYYKERLLDYKARVEAVEF